jgi:hypothetical protein
MTLGEVGTTILSFGMTIVEFGRILFEGKKAAETAALQQQGGFTNQKGPLVAAHENSSYG